MSSQSKNVLTKIRTHTQTHTHERVIPSGLIPVPDLLRFYQLVMTVEEEAEISPVPDLKAFVKHKTAAWQGSGRLTDSPCAYVCVCERKIKKQKVCVCMKDADAITEIPDKHI